MYVLRLRGAPPQWVAEELRRRFDPTIAVEVVSTTHELRCSLPDQAALRSVLLLLWDAGATVDGVLTVRAE